MNWLFGPWGYAETWLAKWHLVAMALQKVAILGAIGAWLVIGSFLLGNAVQIVPYASLTNSMTITFHTANMLVTTAIMLVLYFAATNWLR